MSATRYRPSAVLIAFVAVVIAAVGGMITNDHRALTPISATLPAPTPSETCAETDPVVIEEPTDEPEPPTPPATPTAPATPSLPATPDVPATDVVPVAYTRHAAARADGLCPVWPLECEFYATANVSSDVLTVYINNPDGASRNLGVKVVKIKSAFYQDTPQPDKTTEKIDVPFPIPNGKPDPVTGQGDGDGLYTFDFSKNVDANGKVKPIGVKIQLTVTVKCFDKDKLVEKDIFFRFQFNTAGPRPTIMKLK